jgi:hypothetical protein
MISQIKMAKLEREALTNKSEDMAAKPTVSKEPLHRFNDLAT